MNANKALWEKGDFTRIARSMRDSGAAFVDTLGIAPGLEVLDLGCGDGTTALPAAERGAQVLGVDIASNLVAAGTRRAAQAGLEARLRFQEGDAGDLQGLADDAFDLVVSVFGAMFAPRPDDVAREMVRVARPGGRIVMGNWIPGDPTLVAQTLRISSAYAPPPPPGFVSPMLWGDAGEVVERFARAGVERGDVTCVKAPWRFVYPGTPGQLLAEFVGFYGPTMNAVEAAERDGKADALKAELAALFESQNESEAEGTTTITANFLRVAVAVR